MKGERESGELVDPRVEQSGVIFKLLDQLIAEIPDSSELVAVNPTMRAQQLVRQACMKASAISATLALPSGPLGFLTLIPDLLQVWQVQRQLVADIAACYGKTASLTKQTMVYCLFRHGMAMFARDLLVRVGERMIMKRSSVRVIEQVLQRVSIQVTEKMVGSTVSRFLPLIGPALIGGYSWLDTKKVGQTAIDTFMREIDVEALGEITAVDGGGLGEN